MSARDEAVQLRQQRGMAYKDIAEKLGVSVTTVFRWCNPERAAEYERKRVVYKRDWMRNNYHGTCVDCGGQTAAPEHERCRACHLASQARSHAERLDTIEHLYNAGTPLRDIAAALGVKWSPGVLGRDFRELRDQGRIGWRLPDERVRNMRNARWGVSA